MSGQQRDCSRRRQACGDGGRCDAGKKKPSGWNCCLQNLFRRLLNSISVHSCNCMIFYTLFTIFMLVFLYFYALTMFYQLSRASRGLASLVVPNEWTKSSSDIVQEALEKFSADRIGQADYALESAGGSVLCSSYTYYEKVGPVYSMFGIPLFHHFSNPRNVIQPEVQPGNCWAMEGNQGYVTIQLSMPVIVSSVTLEHIPRELAATGRLDSAPRDFMITGKESMTDSTEVVLGKFTYQTDRHPIQEFKIWDPFCTTKPNCAENNKVYRVITLKVLNNYGHPDYTCLYRFRVHGQPSPTVSNY